MRQDEFNGIILNKTKTKKRHLDATDEQDSINKKIKKKQVLVKGLSGTL